ncbi:MAG: hypothetical protein H5T76_10170, partial [Streptomyces sp.]|nr:hypothetical protein [Streptomyces sp.]
MGVLTGVRRRVPAVVAVLASAVLLAGCGGGNGGADGGDSGTTGATGATGATGKAGGGGPLDAAGIEGAAITAPDLPGYTFTVFQQGDALGSKGRPADPAVCQPIEDIRLRSPEPAPVAAAAR